MSSDDFADASRESWGAAAETWARAGEEPDKAASAAAGAWILEAANLEPGHRVLELACGAGRVGLQAAERVGTSGHVLCSDFAEPMVEAVRARADALGLDNVSTRVLDAEALNLANGEVFDRVLCRFGFMLMANPQRALAESRRALAPDGRLALAVWGTADENPWLALILDAFVSHFNAPPPEPGTPGPFALGDEAHLEAMLGEAGYGEVSVTRLKVEQTYESLDDWWDQVIGAGAPLAAALRSLPESDAEAIRNRAVESARDYAEAGGAVFPAVVVGATAAAPS